MNLYVIHDDPRREMDPEEVCSEHIWADSWVEAVSLYVRESGTEATADQVTVIQRPTEGLAPARQGAHVERRPEVLRPLGVGIEGESACLGCGLYPMGMAAHQGCLECECCPECCECRVVIEDDGDPA